MSTDAPQRIARLTPLRDVLARIGALTAPVASRAVAPEAAVGSVLAQDAVAPAGMPAAPLALRDGFAVQAEVTSDASSYAPVPLARLDRVDLGEPLPSGTDAVVALDNVLSLEGRYQIVAPVAAGEGVLTAAGDLRAGAVLHPAGARLRAVDTAVLAAAGIDRVMVREPRLHLACARVDRTPMRQAACDFIACAISAAGAKAVFAAGDMQAAKLDAALADTSADAIIVVGGTGSGRHDASVHTLGRLGRVEVHGIALSPGETAAFGVVDTCPVLLVPGRFDAAVAVWVTLGRHLLARLAGAAAESTPQTARLARKVASPLGLAEVVPVRLRDDVAEPLASGHWPLSAIARADGFILVPPESEGFPADTEVVVRPWP